MKSKKLLLILLAVGTLRASLAPSMAADTLVLPNPGFEDQLTGWENQDDNGMSKVTAEAAHSGKFGLHVVDDSDLAGSGIYSQKVPVSAGQTYQMQFWARNLSGVGIGVYLRFLKADGKIIAPATEEERITDRAPVVDLDKNQTAWGSMSGTKTAPVGAVAVVIYIHSYSKHKVIADFDDFALSEVGK